AKSDLAPNPPDPLPSQTETEPELLAESRSRLPSALTSAEVTYSGPAPQAMVDVLVTPKVPWLTGTTSAVTLTASGLGPPIPTNLGPAMLAGLLMVNWGRPGVGNTYICMRGWAPSAGVDMLALERSPKSCASAWMLSFSMPPRP